MLIEVLIAATLILSMITLFVPIITLLEEERKIFSDRRLIGSKLHDELQPFLWGIQLGSEQSYTEIMNTIKITYVFKNENNFIKGCATWENVKGKNDEICLYGYR